MENKAHDDLRQRRENLFAELHRSLDVRVSGRGAVALFAVEDLQWTVSDIAEGVPHGGHGILRGQIVVQAQTPEEGCACNEDGIGVGESGWNEGDARIAGVRD